ncbi:MAG: tetratricopeptide repeat protein [Bacteroidetes bacterium]|nr:MAG: tetratricopeptide repeat protein [Bacteroidota bacterium]
MKLYMFILFFPILVFSQTINILELVEQKEKLGKIDTAIRIISENLPKANSKFSVYKMLVKRGYLYMSKNNNLDAELDFEKAIQIIPDSNQAYTAKGYLYLKLGRFFYSVENFDKAIANGNKDISAFFCRAHALWDIKDYEKAMSEINKVLLSDKNHPDANYLKGRIYARTGRYKEALPWYNLALYLQPQYKIAEVYGYRGIALAALGEFDKAEEDLQKSIDGGMQRDEITFAMTEVQRKKYMKGK